MNALKRIGVDWNDRRLIENLYTGQKVRIKIEVTFSEPGVIVRGVGLWLVCASFRQCTFQHRYIEEMMQEAMEQ